MIHDSHESTRIHFQSIGYLCRSILDRFEPLRDRSNTIRHPSDAIEGTVKRQKLDAAPVPPAAVRPPATAFDVPPGVSVPAPPPGTVIPPLARFRGHFIKSEQLSALASAIADLESWTDYGETLGRMGPDQGRLVALMTATSEWNVLKRSAETFLLYARAMEVGAWKEAVVELGRLGRVLTVMGFGTSKLGQQHEGILRLLDATKAIGKRGAATRKEKRKAKGAKGGAAR
jgi:hypothetical protein